MSGRRSAGAKQDEYDFVIVGSGFGGSVCALRLCEKGYRVLLLEKGRRLEAQDFPQTNWDLKRWLWVPQLGWRGLFRMTFFRHLTVLSGVGVGGGSLVYGNTLPVPTEGFFEHPAWRHLGDWKNELDSHYEMAATMLGATTVPFVTPGDRLLQKVALQRGDGDKWEPTRTAVYYGEAGVEVEDPYFDGEGPTRRGCLRCGACMTGCRHNAKNTLDKNYLYLAEKRGLELLADAEVQAVLPEKQGGYRVQWRQGVGWNKQKCEVRAKSVILAAGVMGTLELLFRMKKRKEGLPALSDRLGQQVLTNSESLIGVADDDPDPDHSRGVAITSIYNCSKDAHVEIVRYGKGSSAFAPLAAPHIPGQDRGAIKLIKALFQAFRNPRKMFRTWFWRDWSRSTFILLYMKVSDATLKFAWQRSWWGRSRLVTKQGSGQAPTASLAQASEIAGELAALCKGLCLSLLPETTLNIPTTAHLLGGCPMGEDGSEGVIDAQHRVFGYPGLYVVDGSAISANPGVNPSLTITALAERAMSKIADADGVDSRI